ncbi:MAG TPA: Holliday junction resolvase RuvX [Candidatus Saccharimonadia bacterium]|nr:Holliday junction resolvase RuvX [Candidatus Saccharimonadia bacterium]
MPTTSILALDVGEARVGLALASISARLVQPFTTLQREDVFDELEKIIKNEDVGEIVVGLPRGLDGQETAQTASARAFAKELEKRTDLPIHLQDEAVTSKKAEEELRARGKPYAKGDIDALAATYILEDYLAV